MRNGEKISTLWETHQRCKKKKKKLVALSDQVFFNKQKVCNGPLFVCTILV